MSEIAPFTKLIGILQIIARDPFDTFEGWFDNFFITGVTEPGVGGLSLSHQTLVTKGPVYRAYEDGGDSYLEKSENRGTNWTSIGKIKDDFTMPVIYEDTNGIMWCFGCNADNTKLQVTKCMDLIANTWSSLIDVVTININQRVSVEKLTTGPVQVHYYDTSNNRKVAESNDDGATWTTL
jgi:hypothetical protein